MLAKQEKKTKIQISTKLSLKTLLSTLNIVEQFVGFPFVTVDTHVIQKFHQIVKL